MVCEGTRLYKDTSFPAKEGEILKLQHTLTGLQLSSVVINDNMHSYALFLLASLATSVSAACEREDLKELAIQYVDAQATGSVDEMPPFIDVATVSITRDS